MVTALRRCGRGVKSLFNIAHLGNTLITASRHRATSLVRRCSLPGGCVLTRVAQEVIRDVTERGLDIARLWLEQGSTCQRLAAYVMRNSRSFAARQNSVLPRFCGKLTRDRPTTAESSMFMLGHLGEE